MDNCSTGDRWSGFVPNPEGTADSFRVFALDMPGWRESGAVKPQERDHVGAALQLLDALGIEEAAFIGDSMGEPTAAKLAARRPRHVSYLITVVACAPGPSLLTPGGGVRAGHVLRQVQRHRRRPAACRGGARLARSLGDLHEQNVRSTIRRPGRRPAEARRTLPVHPRPCRCLRVEPAPGLNGSRQPRAASQRVRALGADRARRGVQRHDDRLGLLGAASTSASDHVDAEARSR
ncbi:alpha/beta fold hydrolase [Streptomyces canus]|uniref:alpha/beta fold hydrolase n=1 Tax=Streptomyces canus TaxID=58343 RepID=UPI0038507B1F